MNRLHTFCTELLHHFQCGSCSKWWSIGDAELDKEDWSCPWCGYTQEVVEKDSSLENNTNNIEGGSMKDDDHTNKVSNYEKNEKFISKTFYFLVGLFLLSIVLLITGCEALPKGGLRPACDCDCTITKEPQVCALPQHN